MKFAHRNVGAACAYERQTASFQCLGEGTQISYSWQMNGDSGIEVDLTKLKNAKTHRMHEHTPPHRFVSV